MYRSVNSLLGFHTVFWSRLPRLRRLFGHLEDVHGVLFPSLAVVQVGGDAVVAALPQPSHAISNHGRVPRRFLCRLRYIHQTPTERGTNNIILIKKYFVYKYASCAFQSIEPQGFWVLCTPYAHPPTQAHVSHIARWPGVFVLYSAFETRKRYTTGQSRNTPYVIMDIDGQTTKHIAPGGNRRLQSQLPSARHLYSVPSRGNCIAHTSTVALKFRAAHHTTYIKS